MPRIWVGTKELFWLNGILERALRDEDPPADVFLLAGRVKAEIERLELVETRSHAAPA